MEAASPMGGEEDFIYMAAVAFGGEPSVPFIPTEHEVVDAALRALELGPVDVFYDLGCGDGRVAIAAVKKYRVRRAVCVEIRPELAEEAEDRAYEEGVQDRVVVVNTSFYEVDVSDATAVYLYLTPPALQALKPKLERELRRGARVASLDYEIPGWRPVRVIKLEGREWQALIYLYRL